MLGVGAGLLLSGLVGTAGQAISNKITRDREDTAVQRRAADMQAAGINPTLAAGSPAQAQPLKGALTEGAEKAAMAMSMMKMKKDISKTDAEIANINADTAAKEVGNQYSKESYGSRLEETKAKSMMSIAESNAKTQLRQWVDNDGRLFQGNQYDMQRAITSFDVRIKQANESQARVMSYMARSLEAELTAGGIKNPLISEAVAKAAVAKLAVDQAEWFKTGKYIQAGTALLGAGIGAFGGITGGLLNLGKTLTPSEY